MEAIVEAIVIIAIMLILLGFVRSIRLAIEIIFYQGPPDYGDTKWERFKDFLNPGRVMTRQWNDLMGMAKRSVGERDWLLSVLEEGRRMYNMAKK